MQPPLTCWLPRFAGRADNKLDIVSILRPAACFSRMGHLGERSGQRLGAFGEALTKRLRRAAEERYMRAPITENLIYRDLDL